MKAAINGTLNLSILDGWYPEGYDGTNGFAIGQGEEFPDPEHQDEFESRRLYRTLEEHVIPTFYMRDEKDLPGEWVAMQKRALQTMAGAFSAQRMVEEYATSFYFPCSDRFRTLRADGGARVRALIGWKRYVMERWNGVSITGVKADAASSMQIAQSVTITARIALGELTPNDLRVEGYLGEIDKEGLVGAGEGTPLGFVGVENGIATYSGSLRLERSGHMGIAVRALPWHNDLGDLFEMNLLRWSS
jgi:starch phosphorylase